MRSFFKKFSEGFSKTVSAIASKTAVLFGQKPIDASSLETLEEALYSADFGNAGLLASELGAGIAKAAANFRLNG